MDIKQILNGADTGKWEEIDNSGVDALWRALKPKEYDLFRKQSERKTRQGVVTDHEKLAKLCLDAMIMDWRGLDNNGQSYECTSEHKIELDENWMPFRLFWSSKLSDSVDGNIEITEAVAKN
ncbi:MAG: hypothetical protein IIC67_03370 [Thaumarchaeota archaeon]|nr:hypothetical protein [Nitrososphaerota archaeon]